MYFCSQEQSRAQRRVAAALQRAVTGEAAPLLQHSRADLLVHRLLELLVIEDGSELALAVHRPEGGLHLHLGLAHIGLALVCLVILGPREPRLSPDPLTSCTVPLISVILNDIIIREYNSEQLQSSGSKQLCQVGLTCKIYY